jgi:hypothetical protein
MYTLGFMKCCSVETCTNAVHSAGLCSKHKHRLKKHGDPLAGGTAFGSAQQFMRNVIANPPSDAAECVLWPFPMANGWPRMWVDGRTVSASHVALELSGSPRPSADFHALHHPVVCHNRACVRPSHLRWGTPSENMQDKVLDGTSSRGEQHGRAKLTSHDIRSIRSDTRVQRIVAAEYGITRSYVSRIRSRDVWRWLD